MRAGLRSCLLMPALLALLTAGIRARAEEQVGDNTAKSQATKALQAAQASGRSWLDKRIAALQAAYEAFNEKLSEAAHVDEINEGLRRRIAALETENTGLREQAAACSEQARAERLKAEAVAEGGLPKARTIASLHLSDDALLSKPPRTIYDQALKAFANGDFETSGRALAALLDNTESDDYRTPRAYYLAGVSLYHVGNYKRALVYLTRADAAAKGEEESYAPRALAWKALCYKKLGEDRSEHETIRQLIQRYPRSQEARRLNRNA